MFWIVVVVHATLGAGRPRDRLLPRSDVVAVVAVLVVRTEEIAVGKEKHA